ncbi:unnamed protein product [Mytilus coruscus]|uniref:PHD-type domain-containing protein n=1 Tax=Mytilus coruscus TaxID=42192 RepID=A0A6J8EXL9_MYTCO|nr:unnamed protein product [Mytilus coruscus]
MSKAIKNKIEVASRPHSVILTMARGNIVITFSAAAYEEFKSVTLNYLHSKGLTLNTTETTIDNTACASELLIGPQFPLCLVCNRQCDENPTSVACDICNQWIHFKCEGLIPEKVSEIELNDESYICRLCTNQRVIINSEMETNINHDNSVVNSSVRQANLNSNTESVGQTPLTRTFDLRENCQPTGSTEGAHSPPKVRLKNFRPKHDSTKHDENYTMSKPSILPIKTAGLQPATPKSPKPQLYPTKTPDFIWRRRNLFGRPKVSRLAYRRQPYSDRIDSVSNILDRNDSFSDINKQIREYCEQFLNKSGQSADNCQEIETASTKKNLSSLNVNKASSLQAIDNTACASKLLIGPQFPLCVVCNRQCDENPTSVACDICNQWIHFKCEGLIPEKVSEIELNDESYICRLCTNQRVIINSEMETNINHDNSVVNSSVRQANLNSNTESVGQTPLTRTFDLRETCQPTGSTEGLLDHVNTLPSGSNMAISPDNTELLKAEIAHLQTQIEKRDKLLKIKDSKILKYESEIDQLKKQLSTNRAYSITLEDKNKDLQHSLLIIN